MSSSRPSSRDAITNPQSSASQSAKRSDLLNGKPRTQSLGSKGPGFTKSSDKTSWPSPSHPYGND